MTVYSTTIVNDGISDGRYSNTSIKQVITQLEYFKKCGECVEDLDLSEINVYVSGTDDLVAYKNADESLDCFLAQLRHESLLLGE